MDKIGAIIVFLALLIFSCATTIDVIQREPMLFRQVFAGFLGIFMSLFLLIFVASKG